MKPSRRNLIKFAGAAGAAGLSRSTIHAQGGGEQPEEHFVIFIDCAGGIQWTIGTDGRDPQDVLGDPRTYLYEITDTLPTEAQYNEMIDFLPLWGENFLYPYIGSPEDSYWPGKTTLGARYCLGFTAESIRDYVDKIAVVRGVHMEGVFHNQQPEFFTGDTNGGLGHWAGIVSEQLQLKYQRKLLFDNVFMENPRNERALSTTPIVGLPPISLTNASLSGLIAESDVEAFQRWTRENKFKYLEEFARKVNDSRDQPQSRRQVYETLIQSLGGSAELQTRIKSIGDLPQDIFPVNCEEGDEECEPSDAYWVSLDLIGQFNTCLKLFQAGLTRVATLCLGASNNFNNVDGFGLFDCHQGLFHLDPANPGLSNTQRHHLNMARMYESIKTMIDTLENTPYRDKNFIDYTTVILSTEYARPANLGGNEQYSAPWNFGNSHQHSNNNYILFGKGIKGGAWVGENSIFSQNGTPMDMRYVDPKDGDTFGADEETPQDPLDAETFAAKTLDNCDAGGPCPDELLKGDRRPITPRDIGKTLFTALGLEQEFTNLYQTEKYKDTRVLRAILE